jgi:hypothetical protein
VGVDPFSLSSIGSLWLTSWGYGESEPERVQPELLAEEKDFTDPSKAVSRDLLAAAMARLRDYRIVGHVHDEVILEVPVGSITVDEVCAIMNRNPVWADGLPLSSAGYTGTHYFKD